MDTAVLAARILLAIVFAIAAIAKLRDRHGFGRTLAEFGVPAGLTGTGAWIVPTAELAVAVALLVTATAVSGAVAALVLLLAFSAGIVNALMNERTPDCGCFGQLQSKPVGKATLVRNGALALVALFVAWRGPGPASDAWLLAAAAAAALLAAAVMARRSPAPADSSPQEPHERSGVQLGTSAPEFELAEACDGTRVTLTSLRARGLPVVLVFTSSGCGSCRNLYPHLGRWQTTLSNELGIALVSTGDADGARPLCQEHGIRDVLIDDNAEQLLHMTYRMPGTPSAVAVAPDGRIASAPVYGEDAIEELVRLTLRRNGATDEPSKQPTPAA